MDSNSDFETPTKVYKIAREEVPHPYCSLEEDKENIYPAGPLRPIEKVTYSQEVPIWTPSYGKTDGKGKITYSFLLTKILSSKTATIEWLMNKGVIAKELDCPTCEKSMRLVAFTGQKSTTDGMR